MDIDILDNNRKRTYRNPIYQSILSAIVATAALTPTFICVYLLSLIHGDIWATICASALMAFLFGGAQISLLIIAAFVLYFIWFVW